MYFAGILNSHGSATAAKLLQLLLLFSTNYGSFEI